MTAVVTAETGVLARRSLRSDYRPVQPPLAGEAGFAGVLAAQIAAPIVERKLCKSRATEPAGAVQPGGTDTDANTNTNAAGGGNPNPNPDTPDKKRK